MPQSSKVLSYLNLSDAYERKARFSPAVLAICTFLPAAMALSLPLLGWVAAIATGVGVAAVVSVGLSHLASAMGNRFQSRVFPRWPFDSPTNLRLSPLDAGCSKEQKQRWYDSIKSITGLSIQDCPVDDRDELDRLINDAVTAVRTMLWKHPKADRLHTHNADYGFARNFAGLAPIWLSVSTVSTLICWGSLFVSMNNLGWAIASTTLSVGLFMLYKFVMTDYVKAKANDYADSFFNALKILEAERSEHPSEDEVDSREQTPIRTD